jgi:BirA family biotin operon repressor/biotin-[acetyl-CoA-carboxylase] ligase
MRKQTATLVKLVSLLSDGQFHSGNILGQKLKLTRTAIWKAIKKLEQYGIELDRDKEQGYRLRQPLLLLDPQKIKKRIATTADVKHNFALSVFEEIDSTNNYLKKLTPDQKIQICVSEQQQQGRGRLNRYWHSPFAQNIYYSCRIPLQKDISELGGLSLVVSLAIMNTLQTVVAEGLAIKWPNDIVCQGKKLAGCLLEVTAESHGYCYLIIGIGINVNMLKPTEAITQSWTSLQQITGEYWDRNPLIAELTIQLLRLIEEFSITGLQSFLITWSEHDYLAGKTLTLINHGIETTGVAVGINEQGYLLLKDPEGVVKPYASGDTSVKK